MKYYYVNDFEDREVYEQFIDYMLSYSAHFSFIYFRYRENEKMKKQREKFTMLWRKLK